MQNGAIGHIQDHPSHFTQIWRGVLLLRCSSLPLEASAATGRTHRTTTLRICCLSGNGMARDAILTPAAGFSTCCPENKAGGGRIQMAAGGDGRGHRFAGGPAEHPVPVRHPGVRAHSVYGAGRQLHLPAPVPSAAVELREAGVVGFVECTFGLSLGRRKNNSQLCDALGCRFRVGRMSTMPLRLSFCWHVVQKKRGTAARGRHLPTSTPTSAHSASALSRRHTSSWRPATALWAC